MSQRPRIVPSKNALRTLRALAFSSQAAVVGAVGSVCGLFAIQCHQRQKIQLAERVLETKRTIHVLSNGRGKAQAAWMFDAAERGEDFTLHQGRPKKPRRSRTYNTAVAVKSVNEDAWIRQMSQLEGPNGTSPPLNHSARQASNLQAISEPKHQPGMYSTRLRRSGISSGKSSHRKSSKPPPEPDMPKSMPDLPMLHVNKKFKAYNVNSWSRKVATAELRHRLEEKWRYSAPSDVDSKSRSGSTQEMTDLHPIPPDPKPQLVAEPERAMQDLAPEESVFFNFVFGKPSPDTIFESNVFSSLRPWPKETPPDGPVPEYPLATHAVPSPKDRPLAESFLHVLERRMDAHIRVSYIQDADDIKHILYDRGAEAALVKFEEVANDYASTLNHTSRTALHALLTRLNGMLDWSQLGPILRKVVRKHLASNHNSHEAVQWVVRWLYPPAPYKAGSSNDTVYFHSVQRYMDEFCQQVHNREEQISELRKLYQANKALDIPCHEMVMAPVLRQMTKAGLVKQAQALVTDLSAEFDIESSYYTVGELMRGYASKGDWPTVNSLLSNIHSAGFSRRKLYGFSAMFSSTIEQYASHYPPDKVYKYIESAIHEYGLIPTSAVSDRFLQICLLARRYDLVRGWVIRMYRGFPEVDTGTQSQSFAYTISTVWKRIDASCEDILAGVRALSAHAIRDPFTNAFRGVVGEAVNRDLFARIRTLEGMGSYKISGNWSQDVIYDMHTILTDIKQLMAHISQKGLNSRQRLLAEDLVKQAKAVIDLNELLGGSYDALMHGEVANSHDIRRNENRGYADSTTVPSRVAHSLRTARLPRTDIIINLIEREYTDQHRKSQASTQRPQSRQQPWSHEVLRYTIDRLDKQNRQADACKLLETIFSSPWANPSTAGRAFPIDVFTTWLRFTIDIRSATRFRSVLWHILDAGPELTVTSDLVVLARVGAFRTHDTRLHEPADAAIVEVEYLRARLRRRKAVQKQGGRFVFEMWRGLNDSDARRPESMDE